MAHYQLIHEFPYLIRVTVSHSRAMIYTSRPHDHIFAYVLVPGTVSIWYVGCFVEVLYTTGNAAIGP